MKIHNKFKKWSKTFFSVTFFFFKCDCFKSIQNFEWSFFTPLHIIAQTEATFMILSYQLGLHWRKLVEIYQTKTQRSPKFEKSITKRKYIMFVN